ncbi:MAG: SOS response-associated peptidase, partial [Planctomycetota bacterium]
TARVLVFLRWGLIPSWSRKGPQGPLLINARAETAAEKPSFRGAFRERRCLIPADGFFEWKREGNTRIPYWFFPLSGPLFAFAGLWECWQGAGPERVESCTILTTEANERVRPFHPRMPVVLSADQQERWLDPGAHDPARLGGLLTPCPAEEVGFRQVSPRVNQVRNDDPGVLLPVPPPAPPPGRG